VKQTTSDTSHNGLDIYKQFPQINLGIMPENMSNL